MKKKMHHGFERQIKQEKINRKKKGNYIAGLTYFKISIRISEFLLRYDISPNQITIISLILGLIASFFFALGAHIFLIIGAVILQFEYILDCVDGEIARIKNLESKFGAWLDSISDILKILFILFGFMIGAFFTSNNYFVLIAGIIAVSAMVLNYYTRCLTTSILNVKPTHAISFTKKRYIGGRVMNTILFTLGAVFNQVYLLIIIYAIIWTIAFSKRVHDTINKVNP